MKRITLTFDIDTAFFPAHIGGAAIEAREAASDVLRKALNPRVLTGHRPKVQPLDVQCACGTSRDTNGLCLAGCDS